MTGKVNRYLILGLLVFSLPAVSLPGNSLVDDQDIKSEIKDTYNDADDFSDVFQKANDLYAQGDYEEAARLYSWIMDSGYHSASLYYNLGNSYYRSGNVPAAILNYERAALLAPGDEDIKFNLELAGTHVRSRIEEIPEFFLNRWWQQLRDIAGYRTWATLSVSSFILSLMLLTLFLSGSTVARKKSFFWTAVIVFFISAASFSLGLDQRNYVKNHNRAVVFSPVVSVKSSPDTSSPDLFVIHEGTRVAVEDSIGDWREIRLSDGNKGWLHKESIEMI